MKRIVPIFCAVLLSATGLRAQDASDLDSLKKQLKDATDNFNKVIEQQRRFDEITPHGRTRR